MCSIEEKIANDDVISILVPLNLKWYEVVPVPHHGAVTHFLRR